MSKQEIEKCFPNLLDSAYSITSPSTSEYNCIAWVAEDTEVWWWPDQNNQYYWPASVPRKETLEAFIKVYELLGFTICKDDKYEEGFEKIAIYVDSDGKPTHAAKQLNSGYWTSKLGNLEDIEHQTLDSLAGLMYGAIAIVMKRPKKQ